MNSGSRKRPRPTEPAAGAPPVAKAPAGLAAGFARDGWVVLPGVVPPALLRGFVAQIEAELVAGGGEGERSVGAVSLEDAASWPRKNARRVVECAPAGEGAWWEHLRSSPVLGGALDELFGAEAWEMLFNEPRRPAIGAEGAGSSEGDAAAADAQAARIRHWYFPTTFPEDRNHPRARGGDDGDATPAGAPRRPVLLESLKEERKRVGQPPPHTGWQPVSRRRVRGKGWHIDAGPGFTADMVRTVRGHPFQGAVLLLLLSDHSREGGGNTCFVRGSHRWVRAKLEESEPSGITHHDLNTWAVDRMLHLIRAGKAHIVSGQPAPPDAAAADDADADSAAADDEVEVLPLLGQTGDVCIMHPWLVHSGTTNLRQEVRLMGNGMVRVRGDVFEREGCRVLQL
uniref:Phytanoyl-CoA dioxygenase n=1 Tax=Phaeomonas parva TaxID=124430 RepID=A0A7S1TN59_9STRA|mmetsp:Transcript_10/g.42  ORF Transcript_10/g.42 Transcript_10/m.42 type:complete len:399 (+) Transcript_10:326-1522(+)|eukprot:CAMPEP_0118853120 /NCGR_PEP_ID=MMETSP1163-20130328/1825_1 /TAXON_ID=124430 /ORGANISM="Phaeomonas parva, Strain CCMP2877" /LENGTH=398 /DNA_ID=CAMNT_0006785615 /DNA_START=1274 /DNA_END=2470 /DNA_ORIENTATION=-